MTSDQRAGRLRQCHAAARSSTAAVLGSGLTLLDGTVVNVALRTIGEDLDASLAQLQWINNGYLLTMSALILLGGSLGDRYGRRRIFVVGTIWFAAASLLCGIAPEPTGADRRPHPPGHRRRDADAGQPGDDPGRLRAREPCPGDRVVVGPGQHRGRRRAVRGRCAGRLRLVALDLPDQPAAGRPHRRDRPCAGCPRPATPTPPNTSTSPARSSPRSRSVASPTH